MKKGDAIQVYLDRQTKFRNTQSIQWRMNISVWTLVALAIWLNQTTTTAVNPLVKVVASFIIIGIHFVYCLLTQFSLESDKAVANKIINKLCDKQENLDFNPSLRGDMTRVLPWLWICLQTGMTVLLVSFYCALDFKP